VLGHCCWTSGRTSGLPDVRFVRYSAVTVIVSEYDLYCVEWDVKPYNTIPVTVVILLGIPLWTPASAVMMKLKRKRVLAAVYQLQHHSTSTRSLHSCKLMYSTVV